MTCRAQRNAPTWSAHHDKHLTIVSLQPAAPKKRELWGKDPTGLLLVFAVCFAFWGLFGWAVCYAVFG